MHELDFTAALGRLLSSARLRSDFAGDRERTVRSMNVRACDRETVIALDPLTLEAQAQALLNKRLHETARILPRTFGNLGKRAVELFIESAQDFWPTGHLRHVADAAHFGAFLMKRKIEGIESIEVHRAQFRLGKKRVAIKSARAVVNGKRRRSLQILCRGRYGQPKEIILYLGL